MGNDMNRQAIVSHLSYDNENEYLQRYKQQNKLIPCNKNENCCTLHRGIILSIKRSN